LCTALTANEKTVRTVEHLLAALSAVTEPDVLVTVDGPEVPILDGSAAPWYRALLDAGATPGFRFFDLTDDLTVHSSDSVARVRRLRSGEVPTVCVKLDFKELHGGDEYHFHPSLDDFETIALARTFAFEKDLQGIFDTGLAKGGSLDNAVVLGKNGPVNPEGLRFEDEPLRHKMLDVIGDLALLGGLPRARIHLLRPGHHLLHALVGAIEKNKKS
jgi:UDP-3-O-[3-hydroxymyristoyl] N-acetylglucosamine deacetylase